MGGNMIESKPCETLDDLAIEAEKVKGRQRRKYHLARELGFNAYEATVLQNKAESTIRHLAVLKAQATLKAK